MDFDVGFGFRTVAARKVGLLPRCIRETGDEIFRVHRDQGLLAVPLQR